MNHVHSSGRVVRRSALALGLAFSAVAVVPSLALAQQTVVVQSGGEGRSDYRGPNWELLGSGLAVFGGTYVASVVVAGTSSRYGDKDLYAPLVGPWMDLGRHCYTGCDGEPGRSVLLALDGVFQGVGVLAVISSLLVPRRSAVSARTTTTALHLVPASLGRGAPGLMLAGAF